MFNTRLYRVNFEEANVQGMGITILREEENIPINSDTLITLQKFFEEDVPLILACHKLRIIFMQSL